MITEEQIDWAIKVLEDPRAIPFTKQAAHEIAHAFVQQEQQTLDWMCQCYASCRIANDGQQRYAAIRSRAR